MNYTNVEAKLRQIRFKLLNSDQLANGGYDQTIFKGWWTQLSKNGTIKDFKRRVTDIL